MSDAQQPNDSQARSSSSGPLNLEAIRQARLAQEQEVAVQQPIKRLKRPGSQQGNSPEGADASGSATSKGASGSDRAPEKIDAEAMPARHRSNRDAAPAVAPKVPVPSVRRRDQL